MTIADRLLSDLTGDDADVWNRLLGPRTAAGQGFVPPVDLYETENEYVVELDVPGLVPENLSAEVVNGQLVIAGERQPRHEADRFFRRERWSGRFVRTFTLGQSFSTGDIQANYEDGVLVVRVAKPEETKPKKITIGSGRKQLSASAK